MYKLLHPPVLDILAAFIQTYFNIPDAYSSNDVFVSLQRIFENVRELMRNDMYLHQLRRYTVHIPVRYFNFRLVI